ncbi:MAG: thermonuclease family protein [Sphingomonas sp.]
MRGLVPTLLAGALGGLALASWMTPGAPVFGGVAAPAVSARFGYCRGGGGTDCVVDGDTFRMAGERIRIADIDTPETHPPRCAEEARLGEAATRRLHALLNAGPVTLEPVDRDTDSYGRKLRIVTRGGRSLGDTLVAEGLARPWTGRRQPWC